MSYPRSRLFRNYEAQLLSQQKQYPRSNLFKAYESQKQNVKEEPRNETAQIEKVQVSWGEDEDEMNFTFSNLNY